MNYLYLLGSCRDGFPMYYCAVRTGEEAILLLQNFKNGDYSNVRSGYERTPEQEKEWFEQHRKFWVVSHINIDFDVSPQTKLRIYDSSDGSSDGSNMRVNIVDNNTRAYFFYVNTIYDEGLENGDIDDQATGENDDVVIENENFLKAFRLSHNLNP